MQDTELKVKLVSKVDEMKICCEKMTSSTKFIDFFVHDMLDYAILLNSSKVFMKNIIVSNIKDVIQEVTMIMKDKLAMYNIELELELKGFTQSDLGKYLIKTDLKRI